MPRSIAPTRDAFLYFETLPTRWNDNDVYGHINNSVYYFFFDTLVNNYLIKHGLLEIGKSDIIGLVVETLCQYFAPLSYPVDIEAGLAIRHIGRSSVTYEIGLFAPSAPQAAAAGHFTHVYVDAVSRKSAALPDDFKKTLGAIKP
jgi:acyl-CoA thioester hydrolase